MAGTALAIGLGASAVGNLLSNWITSEAAKDNADTYSEASANALKAYQDAYNESYGTGSYNDQVQNLGLQALQKYYSGLNDSSAWDKYVSGDKAYQAPDTFSFTAEDLYSDPSYQFRLQQGQDALAQNQVAGGLNLSGAAAKQMNDYTQNVASEEYQNAYNRAYKQYTDDRSFDYNQWLNESKQYYENLTNKLTGLNNVSTAGINANNIQSTALQGLAGAQSNNAAQLAAAQSMSNSASASASANNTSTIANLIGTLLANSGTDGDTATSKSGSYAFDMSEIDPTLYLNGYNQWLAQQTGSTLY